MRNVASLIEIGLNGFAGTAPTPVLQYAIDRYLVQSEFMAIQQFVNIAAPDNLGNLKASAVVYDDAGAPATNRAIGEDYTPDAEEPKTVDFALKQLGGAFPVDRMNVRAFGSNPGMVSNWIEQQTQQKMNKIINGFAYQSFTGNILVSSKQFDGINKFFTTHPGQVIADAFDASAGLSADMALKVERHLNNIMAKLRVAPNVCYTTRSGKTYAQAINAHRNRGVEVVEVNSRKFHQILGVPVIALPDNCFSAADLAKGIPFVFGYISEIDGIRYAVPMDGKVVDIILPTWSEGKFVTQGGIEISTVPILADPYILAKGYVTETGNQVPITGLEISGESTLDLVDNAAGSTYNVAVTPVNATVKAVTWSIDPNSTGNVDLSDAADLSVKVIPTEAGAVTLIATAADGSKVTDELEITITE